MNFPETGSPQPAGHDASVALFGCGTLDGVVAGEIEGSEAHLFLRQSNTVTRVTRGFTPWILTDGSDASLPHPTRLDGPQLNSLHHFPDLRSWREARRRLQAEHIPHLTYGDPLRQFLTETGVTFFRGLRFEQVHRMQFDLETTGLKPDAPDAKILLIAVSDNRGLRQALGPGPEKSILTGWVDLIRCLDPDVLENHNLMGFDLPYLYTRAEQCGVPLRIGRNRSVLRRVPRGAFGRRGDSFRVWGRQLVDTLPLVRQHDFARGELMSYGLKEVARALGLSDPDRVLLPGAQIPELVRTDPDRVRAYALGDVDEVRRLSDRLLPTAFFQSQMVPMSLEGVLNTGTGEKIDSLLVREYLRRSHAIPLPVPPKECSGGYTEVRRTGMMSPVAKADIESLYPSIMLTEQIRPRSDRLGVFLPLLEILTARRLEAKANSRASAAVDGHDAEYWDALQGSFKILINSFYGYLGAVPFHFNDFDAADAVTSAGRRLILQVVEEMERTGAQVIEIDTDGVYFVPPLDRQSGGQDVEYTAEIASVLPAGIRLAWDGRYRAMLSLKMKNYVLIREDGGVIARGSAVRSRAEERFGREFLVEAAQLLAAGDLETLRMRYAELQEKCLRGQLPLEALMRRERVTERTRNSPARKRTREAAGEAEAGETLRVYQRQDGAVALAEQYAGDEDRWYYAEKLHRFALRLEPALGDQIHQLFPPPTRRRYQEVVTGQLTLF